MVGYMAEMVLKDRRVLFIGGGQVALRKIKGVLPAAPQITVIAPTLHPQLDEMVKSGQCHHQEEQFYPEILDNYTMVALVFAVTGEASLNQEIARHCAQRGLWCNSADDPESSSFLVPAVVRQGPITWAVSSGGCSPSLSRLLKERLELWLEPGWGSLAELFGAKRSLIKQTFPQAAERQRFWRDTCLAVVREQQYNKTDHGRWLETRISLKK